MICVIATIELKDGCRDEFLAIARRHAPGVLAESGCIEYGPMIDAATRLAAQAPAGENVVFMVEKWASPAALRTHLESPQVQEFRQATAAMRKQVTLRVLQPA
jgi:quinol monooxygenase YgiN